MSFFKSDYNYNLPPELIADKPITPRDHSRMMVLNSTQKSIDHRHFYDLPELLDDGSLLVVNNSKVIPARLLGSRKTGAGIEVLLIAEVGKDTWTCKVKNSAKIKTGESFFLCQKNITAKLIEKQEDGNCTLQFEFEGDFFEILQQYAHAPIPPYIHKVRTKDIQREADLNTYQTVYAQTYGAIAAPTAGLHFTKRVIDQLNEKKIEMAEITLHVGLGTFEPIRVDDIRTHDMHTERYHISTEIAETINHAKIAGKKIVAVGTTSVRTLEAAQQDGIVKSGSGQTNIFIYPPYSFNIPDQLITNFHLPESTLLMLVSAFAGKEFIRDAYATAINQKYRFYSYGDCMLINKSILCNPRHI